MAVYLVERDLPGITMEQLAQAQKRAIQMGRELTAEGREVRYIRSMFVPGEHKCMLETVCARRRVSMKSGQEKAICPPSGRCQRRDIKPRESTPGRGLRMTAFSQLKMVALAPMPKANVKAAARVKAGFLRSCLAA